jgi:hypothetical protein
MSLAVVHCKGAEQMKIHLFISSVAELCSWARHPVEGIGDEKRKQELLFYRSSSSHRRSLSITFAQLHPLHHERCMYNVR